MEFLETILRAAVLETTGDVTILHGGGRVEAVLLENVKR